MPQTGYTPIQLYRSTTASAVPSAANLNPGELAININDADMALYAENASGTVKKIINNPAGLTYPAADGTSGQFMATNGSGTIAFTSTLAGDITFANAIIETVFALTGTTPALNPSNGTIQTWTLSGNSTPTDSLASGEAMTLMVDDGSACTS
jgi:hypothetical protein